MNSKLRLLPPGDRENTRKLIKGLAYVSFRRQSEPAGIKLGSLLTGLNMSLEVAEARQLLEQLMKVTGQQYIDKVGQDYFRLDLVHTLDYDQIIKNKASVLTHEQEKAGLREYLEQKFRLEISCNNLYDNFLWKLRNSFHRVKIGFEPVEETRTDCSRSLSLDLNLEQDQMGLQTPVRLSWILITKQGWPSYLKN